MVDPAEHGIIVSINRARRLCLSARKRVMTPPPPTSSGNREPNSPAQPSRRSAQRCAAPSPGSPSSWPMPGRPGLNRGKPPGSAPFRKKCIDGAVTPAVRGIAEASLVCAGFYRRLTFEEVCVLTSVAGSSRSIVDGFLTRALLVAVTANAITQ